MFPIYVKSIDSKNFFKVLNSKEFIQLKIMGSKIKKYHLIANKYPEFVLINDMIECNTNYYEYINEVEFQKQLDKSE